MRVNTTEIIEISMQSSDQEGRLTYKPPTKSLYESAYKERWFKLKNNLLFYYRLNDEGAVEKNEPYGVFILENVVVERDKQDSMSPYGFTITWKDDKFRKHSFYTLSENLLQIWITKLIQASYETLRAELLVLRLKIRHKTGKDPLEQLGGTPLPIRSLKGLLALPSKASSHLYLSPSVSDPDLESVNKNSVEGIPSMLNEAAKSAPSTPSLTPKEHPPNFPLPPPRTNKNRKKNAKEVRRSVAQNGASFKSHLKESTANVKDSGSFKSYYGELTDQK